MSSAAVTWAREQKIADAAMKGALVHLAYMHKDGRPLFPSQQLLADAMGCSARTVWTALGLLEHFGLIVRNSRSKGAAGRTSDAFSLQFEKRFTESQPLKRETIRAVRTAFSNPQRMPSSNSQRLRSAAGSSQLATVAGGSRNSCEGIGDEEELLGQEEALKVEVGTTREANGRPALKVIGGGRA